MTTLTEPIDPAVQAAADALPRNFYFPELLLEAWDNIRFRRRIPLEDFASPPRVDKRPRNSHAMDDVADVEDSGGGIGHVSAQAPSDESLSLPTTVAAACMHLTKREVRLAKAVASATGVKVLEDSEGLRNALSAVLAMLRERGGAERVLLIVPETDVVNWKIAAMEAQDEVNVTCFVKAAGATKNCLANLTKCRKPGIVIAAKEYLHKKTRDPSKAPHKKLYEALQAGGASRWELVLSQCGDADLDQTCTALSLLEQRRLDSLLLFGRDASSKLTASKVIQILSDSFPTVERDDIELTLPEMDEHSLPRIPASQLEMSTGHQRRDSGRIILQPLHGNIAVAPRVKKVPRRSLSESPLGRKRSSSRSVFDNELIPDCLRRRSQGRSSSSPKRDVKRAISRRGRISRDHVQTSLRESLASMSSPYRASYSPHVVMKRKSRKKPSSSDDPVSGSLVAEDEQKPETRRSSVSVDSNCENLANKHSKEMDEVIVIDSDFDEDCFVVSETKSSPRPLRLPTISRSSSKTQSSLKLDNGRRSSKSPTKRRSPLKTRSATLKKLIASSIASASVNAKSPSHKRSAVSSNPASGAADSPAKSKIKSPFAKALEDAVERKHAASLSQSLSLKRTATLPSFAERGPTYETSARRRTSDGKEHVDGKSQRRKSSSTKKERPSTVKYAAHGLIPAEMRKRYNSALRKAKAADKAGDEEGALKWYLFCSEISNHDKTLMARILCFGGYASGEFDADKEKRRLSFKNVSPKRSGGSSNRRQDSSSSVPRSRSRRKVGAKAIVPPCEVIVIDD